MLALYTIQGHLKTRDIAIIPKESQRLFIVNQWTRGDIYSCQDNLSDEHEAQ